MKKIGMLSFLVVMILGLAGSAYAISPVTHAADCDGTVKDVYIPTEDICQIGSFEEGDYNCTSVGEACSGFVDLYVVSNRDDWIGDGTEALVEVGDGVETLAVSGTCDINQECRIVLPATLVWSAETSPGDYDFIVDVNQDAILDSFDPVDDAAITGFSVLPEFTTIGAALVLLGSGLYARFKRRKL